MFDRVFRRYLLDVLGFLFLYSRLNQVAVDLTNHLDTVVLAVFDKVLSRELVGSA